MFLPSLLCSGRKSALELHARVWCALIFYGAILCFVSSLIVMQFNDWRNERVDEGNKTSLQFLFRQGGAELRKSTSNKWLSDNFITLFWEIVSEVFLIKSYCIVYSYGVEVHIWFVGINKQRLWHNHFLRRLCRRVVHAHWLASLVAARRPAYW